MMMMTISYRRFQLLLGVTSGYMGLQVAKTGIGGYRGYKGLQRVLRGYKGLQWFTQS